MVNGQDVQSHKITKNSTNLLFKTAKTILLTLSFHLLKFSENLCYPADSVPVGHSLPTRRQRVLIHVKRVANSSPTRVRLVGNAFLL